MALIHAPGGGLDGYGDEAETQPSTEPPAEALAAIGGGGADGLVDSRLTRSTHL
jgi:hypothetical protein